MTGRAGGDGEDREKRTDGGDHTDGGVETDGDTPTPGADDPREAAVTALLDREPRRAGDLYALAGRATTAGRAYEGEGRAMLGADAGWAAYGLSYLLLSAACYRAAGEEARARTRSAEGVAVAADYARSVATGVDRAAFEELRGDFGVVGGLDVDGYDAALARHDEDPPADPTGASTRPAFEGARAGAQQLARLTPAEFSWDELHGGSAGDFLAGRVRFKRRRLPTAVAAVVDRGWVATPRGTTEHGNDDWRCPDCGRGEVNWTGGEVACLDCDVRMERR